MPVSCQNTPDLLIERIIVGDIQFVRSSLCERDAVADKREIIERIFDIPLQQIFHILCRLVLIGIVDDCLAAMPAPR